MDRIRGQMNHITLLKIVFFYILVGLGWNILSSSILRILELQNNIWLNMLEEVLFVFSTGLFLYMVLKSKIEKIEEREQQLHTLIDSMPDFVNFKDAEGRWLESNKFGLQLFDLEGVDFKGKKDSELAEYADFYKDALLYCEKSDQIVWDFGKTVRCEEVIPQKAGGMKTFDTLKVPLYNNDGSKKGLVVIGRDITERKKIEEQLEDSEQLYRSLFENNGDAVCTLDLTGCILSINEATVHITGYNKHHLLYQSFYKFLIADDQKQMIVHLDDVREGKSRVSEVRYLHKEGHIIYLNIKDVPIIRDGKVHGFFLIARDVSEHKKNEEYIIKSEKLSIIGELASAVAHEIRNPLTSLKGFIQLLQKKDTENKLYYDIMSSEIDRINSIASEFLILSKPQATQFKKINIDVLLHNVITLVQTIAIMKNVKISIDIENRIPELMCEENQMKQVFINILKNAVEAVPEGGQINVSAQLLNSGQIFVSVEDNGAGIPKRLLPKLGEPFYTTKEKGTGLGLMISNRIIQQHRGWIKIESEEGKGTNVEITLPA